MKMIKNLAVAALTLSILGGPLLAWAADKKAPAEIKPYPLKTCVVTDEKLGEMGKPYVFTNETREVKLCCKACLKDFKKDPAKYMKKINKEEAKAKGKR